MAEVTKRSKLILLAIILIASFLRLWKLDQVPVSLFSDELDVGYQAYSIIKTGKDYSGNTLPLHFESQAEFRTPLYIYSAVPTVMAFGITPYGVRLPAAIFGILGIIAIYLLVRELMRGSSNSQTTSHESLALLSALLLAISPWHIQYGRAAFEATMMLFFLMMGLFFFLRFINSGKGLWIAVLLLALTPWIYSTTKLFFPIFALAIFLIWKKDILKLKRKKLVKSILVGLIIMIPMIFITLRGQAGSRFSYISVFTDPTLTTEADYARLTDSKMRNAYGGGLLSKAASRIFHNPSSIANSYVKDNYLRVFSTEFLFISGDINLRHSIDGMGQLYRSEFLILILGIIFFFTSSKKSKSKKLIASWILFGAIPSSITRDGGHHATRLILILPPLLLLISYGVYELSSRLKPFYSKVTILLFFLSLFAGFMRYQHEYWYHNPWHSERSWHAGYKELVEGIREVEDDYEKIIVTNAVEPPWIFFVSYYPYPPELGPRNLTKENIFGFGDLEKLDKFYFGQVGKIGVKNLARILDNNTLYVAAEREVGVNLIMDPQKTPLGLSLIKSITYPSGEPAFYFFKRDVSVEVKPLENTILM